ncbi:GNAT family N-acetyltransferase [Halalkalibacter hemicellulosilyticus]|uniref:GNAT family acetyltransferase BA2847 n=1 Tax=Halalkalibacter hemicellulosilyticusJCM 9152 TaxID=1236971 RepID=W4QBK0_9BACI|nr:GNAT family N-acetyltransferase [Halalkalibacter hemicellulosilyticus]GAE29342.1 GNAT family acetyltransferase BA2847 [Halalkalibacter hemicellulosilyticusJCM 9152]
MRKEELSKKAYEGAIETERLILRELSTSDIQNVYEIVRQDLVGLGLRAGKGMSLKETAKYVNKFLEHWDRFGFGVFGLLDKTTGTFVGHCGLRYIEGTNDVEILYALESNQWGKGYATEASKASIRYAFEILKVSKLTARVKLANYRSKKVIERMGFEYLYDKNNNGIELSYYELFNK